MTNPTQPAEGMPEPAYYFRYGETKAWRADVVEKWPECHRVDMHALYVRAASKASPMPDDVYGAMLSTIGAASMYLSREQMKPFIDWLKAQGFTKE